MKSGYYLAVAGLCICCLAGPSFAQSGGKQDATGGKTPVGATGSGSTQGAMGSMGSGSVTGKQAPAKATGSMGSGGVTGKTAPRGATGRGSTQGATGNMQDSDDEETDNQDDRNNP
jgi:hypothetical protein